MAYLPEDFEWSTRGDDPDNPIPVSTFPSLGLGHVLSGSLVPIDSPARLENHRNTLADVLGPTEGKSTYAVEHSSSKAYEGKHIKTHETDAGVDGKRETQTNAATAYAVKAARFNAIMAKIKTPSAAKKSLEAWKKQGNAGLPPQHMTFSSPTVRQVQGKPHLCITCTVDQAYPNFQLRCIYQYLHHTEDLNGVRKEVRLAFAIFQTLESNWVVALEQKGVNDGDLKGVVGEGEYARLEGEAIGRPVEGYTTGPATGLTVVKKIEVDGKYEPLALWCQTEGFYQVNLYIPEYR